MNNSRANNLSLVFLGNLEKNKTTIRLYRVKHVSSTPKSIVNLWGFYDLYFPVNCKGITIMVPI